MSQQKNTPPNGKSSTTDVLPILRLRTNNGRTEIQTTKADADATKHILALYNNEQTPELIKSAIFRLFHDYHSRNGWPLPKNFTEQWQKLWPLVLAHARKSEYMVSFIRYTWQPTPEEEARLDAHDELRTEADVIFDLMNGEGLPDEFQSNIREVIADLLCTTKVDVFNELSLWREAWKLVSERTAAQDKLERGIE